MTADEHLEQQFKNISEEVNKLESKRDIDRTVESKVQLTILKKQKLQIKDQLQQVGIRL